MLCQSHDGREEKLWVFILNHPHFEELKGSPQKLLQAIDEFSATEHFLISIGAHKSQVLSETLEKEKPSAIVELGGYLGYSAIFFASTVRSTVSPDHSFHVWSVELEPFFASIAEKLIDLAGLSSYISVVVGTAEEGLAKLKDQSDLTKIDLLFIDHVEKLYKQDFEVARRLGLFKKGTVVVADNVVRPGAPEYRQFVRSDPTLSSRGVRGLIQPGNFEVG
jgi:catechol O-methyltransferase